MREEAGGIGGNRIHDSDSAVVVVGMDLEMRSDDDDAVGTTGAPVGD